MDARPETGADNPVIVSGLGLVGLGPEDPPCDPMPYLKVKKLRKYMGVQDDLAVVAAAKALESAGLAGVSLGERAGLYLAVGYIPFEQGDLDPLLAASLDAQGNFSMAAFSTAGFRAVNGLLTFRCLPNMPAFHVSANFDVQGPYFVTYPGPGQFYVALEEALTALEDGVIDTALVGGVAHQRNFLVESHFARVEPPIAAERLLDAAGFVILERESRVRSRGSAVRSCLTELTVEYHPHDPFDWSPGVEERFNELDMTIIDQPGPASLPAILCFGAAALPLVRHSVRSRDGVIGASVWRRP
jgi:hypothetical protein